MIENSKSVPLVNKIFELTNLKDTEEKSPQNNLDIISEAVD